VVREGVFMKKIMIAILAVATLASAVQASDRMPVDKKVFDLVRNNMKLEEFRVYISKKVKTDRESSISQQDNIGADITRESLKKLQNEKLGNDVRGKIIATETNENFSNPLLYVSFDKACTKKSCSYIFSITEGIAKLYFVPSYGMDKIKVRSKKGLFYHKWAVTKHNDFVDHAFLSSQSDTSYKHRPVLEYKLSENDATVRDEIRNRGW
jgi:hypothetical protein